MEVPLTGQIASGFMLRLKAQTSPNHRALEQTTLSGALMDDFLTPQAYARVLYGFYGAFQPIEHQISRALEGYEPALRFLPRAPLAEQDIRSLTGTFDPSRLPAAPPAPAVGLPEALGMMYVLEGSKLGGRLISRQVGKSLGAAARDSRRFFSGGDADDWKTFKEYCEDYARRHPDQAGTIIRSARATFLRIEEYFRQVGSPYGE